MQRAPLLSVIMPVFCCRTFVRAAVSSLLTDGVEHSEVIVIDDASDDGTLAAVSDLPIVQVRLPLNRGASAARNAGLTRARGKFIAFFDGDDLLEPGGLLWRLAWLERHRSCGAVAGEIAALIGASDEVLSDKVKALRPADDLPKSPLRSAMFARGAHMLCPLSLTMYRREIVEATGAFDVSLRCAQDLDFFYRSLRHTAVEYVERPVYRYRLHPNSRAMRWENGALRLGRAAAIYGQFVQTAHGFPPFLAPPA